MLETQFYARIVLTAIFGILFILSMLKKGKKNSIENPPKKRIGLKILSGIFLVMSLVELVGGISLITNIQFPTQMVQQPITANMILRPSSATLFWGYPTFTQNMALRAISGAFALLAFAAYFAVFRKSKTNWWQKFLKVFCIVLMYVFYVSATDLHYFDVWELFFPICFLVLVFIGFSGGKRAVKEESATDLQEQQTVCETEVPSSETIIETTDVEL